MSSGMRRITVVLAALVVLSIVLGDTWEGDAAGVASAGLVTVSPLAVLPNGDVAHVAAPAGQPGDATSLRPQVAVWAKGEERLHVHAIAGIPPWLIWPPSPMPRFAGTFVRRPVLHALAGYAPTALYAGSIPAPPLLLATPTTRFERDLDVLAPPARLAGADHSIPRPPPDSATR